MPAVSTDRTVRRKVKQTAGRKRGQKDKITCCSGGPIAPDFLKQEFLSISFNEGCNKDNWEKIEQDFFTSFKHLCALHKIDFDFDLALPFPMNIATAYRMLKEHLEKVAPSLYLAIAENRNKTTLATIKPLTKDYDLFYVPLNALDELHSMKNKPCFELVLSIFGYLNKHARLPLLCENDYLTGCYDAITEWVTNAENELDAVEYNHNCAELKAMHHKICILEKAVCNPSHLLAYKQRLRTFKPGSLTEKRLKVIARKFYSLFQEYPNTSFYKNISCDHLAEDEGERGYPDHYFSFFWDDHSWMHDHLMEYVNCDLQEMAEFEVPVSVQYFDRTQASVSHALPFENKLLNQMDELCSVLYRFSYEKRYC
ncbi:MAG: hypothetical protein V4539_16555 [Bacteroidota bacterium]